MLALLAFRPTEGITSEQIASSVNTNPVVIRRLLGRLRKAGYVESKSGAGGGWRLKRDPACITLLDVLRAVEPERETIALHAGRPNPLCAVGKNIQSALRTVYFEAQQHFDSRLSHSSIAEMLRSMGLESKENGK